MRLLLLLALLVAGCAAPPSGEMPPEEQTPAAPPPPLAARESMAIAGLMQTARADSAAGKHAEAAAALERGLRIEPRNPRLWQELARVRLKQDQPAQAESLAARSNSWAGDDRALRAENWRLIAQSREARGDSAGAKAALENSTR